MDKKTLLAIALSMVVIGVGLFIQMKFFPAPVNQNVEKKVEVEQKDEKRNQTPEIGNSNWSFKPVVASLEGTNSRIITAETEELLIQFSTRGGTIQSYQLKKHKEKNGLPVELIIDNREKSGAFNIAFGSAFDLYILDELEYRHDQGSDLHVFYRDYIAENKKSGEKKIIRVSKEYRLYPGEYLFELTISLKAEDGKPLPVSDEALYTLQFGPQLGPEFSKLVKGKNRTGETREFYTYGLKKKKTVKVPKKEQFKAIQERFSWVALNGKYFSAAIIPPAADILYTFSTLPVDGVFQANQMLLTRLPEQTAVIKDTYRIYIGPNTKRQMSRYNDSADNKAGLMETKLDDLVAGGFFLGWLEDILMKILVIFYKMIPNYGIAIILLTVFIKIILFPFTWKSFESTTKMQAIHPKIQELQAKYKDEPAKMNQELADLYKREGVNPMGGCLPQLLQMPVLIALYGLLNRYFDLRGAVFIPGWISDLSSPESVAHFGFTIPFVDISSLRLLPIIYLVIQLLTSLVMQGSNPAPGGSNAQMKMMTYGMPILFFFLFYNMPSGLLLYWTMTNVLSLVQQLITNKVKSLKKS